MRGLIILLIIVGITFFSFLVANTNTDKIKTAEETKKFEFSTFTSAVCEEKKDLFYCKDEVFVNCNGNVSKAVDIAECNEVKLDIPKATGFAVFEKGWKDPRIS